MIIKSSQNTPVAAPQFADTNAALVRYRTFRNNQVLTMADFLKFVTTPGTDRDEFLKLFTDEVLIEDSYAQIIYS